MDTLMKASELFAPQIGLIVWLPETEDSHEVVGRLTALVRGPHSNVTLYLGGLECEVPGDQQIELITPGDYS